MRTCTRLHPRHCAFGMAPMARAANIDNNASVAAELHLPARCHNSISNFRTRLVEPTPVERVAEVHFDRGDIERVRGVLTFTGGSEHGRESR